MPTESELLDRLEKVLTICLAVFVSLCYLAARYDQKLFGVAFCALLSHIRLFLKFVNSFSYVYTTCVAHVCSILCPDCSRFTYAS